MDKVVDPCVPADGGGGAGGGGAGGGGESMECTGTVGPGEIDARSFHCGEHDDIGVALTGLHPSAVWITRLESNLPHEALSQDMALQAEATQAELDNWIAATEVVHPPCTDYELGAAPVMNRPVRRPPPPRGHRDLIVLGIGLAALATAAGRRVLRRAPGARPHASPAR